jgi:hypothetical protein
MQSLDEYLDRYGGHLAQRCRERLRPLHDPHQPVSLSAWTRADFSFT